MAIDLTIPGKPHPAGRPRFARIGKGVRTYPAPGDGPAKARVQAAWVKAGCPTLDGPWTASIVVEVPRPKSHWTKSGLSATGRRSVAPPGDVDNFAKTILDALVQVGAVPDDRFCVALSVVKAWAGWQGAAGEVRVSIGADEWPS